MFCSKCGKENLDSAKICGICGNPLHGFTTEQSFAEQKNKGDNKKRFSPKTWIFGFVFVFIISLASIWGYSLTHRGVIIEDPLVERCIRETLGKDIDDRLTMEEIQSIRILVIDCQYDTSFSQTLTVPLPGMMVCNYVDLCDLKKLTGLEELYIDNSYNSDYIANFDAITSCTKLKKLCVSYNPNVYYGNGETAKGYKYLGDIIEQLPNLTYLDLGHYVTGEYKELLYQYNPAVMIYDGNGQSYIDEDCIPYYSHEGNNVFWTESVAEYTQNWKYFYDGNAFSDKSSKAGLRCGSQEELNAVIDMLPADTEDIFVAIFDFDVVDISVFKKFENLKTLSIRGEGKFIGEFKTQILNIDSLRENEELFSVNFFGCTGDFSQLSEIDFLKELSLVACTFETAVFLEEMSNLRELTLIYDTCEDLENTLDDCYSKLANLRYLRVQNANSLSGIEKCQGLETLFVMSNEGEFKTTEYLGQCKSLKNISIFSGNVKGLDLLPLRNLTKLETLYVGSNYVENLDCILQLPNIVSVTVDNFTKQSGEMFVEELNDAFALATNNANLSYFNPIDAFYNGDYPNGVLFENINFKQLHDTGIIDGIIQRRMCSYWNQMTFEEAYEYYVSDYILNIF